MIVPERLRVTVVSPEFPPHVIGGLGTHVACMTNELRRHVCQDLIVPARGGYQAAPRTVKIHEIPCGASSRYAEYWLGFCRAVSGAAIDLSFDVIQCHDWMTVLAGAALARRSGKPLVYNVHLPQLHPPSRTIEDLGLIHADVVIVNSRAVKAELRARGLPIRRLEVIPNGVDLKFYQPPSGMARKNGSILFVGRLVPQKGIDVLLRAFGAVLRRLPEARLVVAGDGELQIYFERLTRRLGFPHRVSFESWQTGSSLLRLYHEAQVVVVPSWYEPFGIVALEAMACGCPVIASRVGGLEEIVEDRKQGYLVPRGDHLALAARLTNLLRDERKRKAMGRAARARARLFSWKSAAAQTADVFRTARRARRAARAEAAAERALGSMGSRKLSKIAAGLLCRTE